MLNSSIILILRFSFLLSVLHYPLLSSYGNDEIKNVILFPMEEDLTPKMWSDIVSDISQHLSSSHHPSITESLISEFKRVMLGRKEFSIKTLQDGLSQFFAVGHLGLVRNAFPWKALDSYILEHYPDKNGILTIHDIYANRSLAYLYDKDSWSDQAIQDKIKDEVHFSIEILKTKIGDIPRIKIRDFEWKQDSYQLFFTQLKNMIGHLYPFIIIDLRDNKGGRLDYMYSFISLFLGDNEPDISPFGISCEKKVGISEFEKNIQEVCHFPFHQRVSFEEDLIHDHPEFKNALSYKKIVIWINHDTFSSGECAAANLKSVLKDKVCLLGEKTRGSFEMAGVSKHLVHNFIIGLPDDHYVFYSKKYQKILTGQKLLPDRESVEGRSFLEQTTELFEQGNPCPEEAVFEKIL